MRKILIIKLGITETIGNRVHWKGVSFGDIFRTTVLLHLFKKDEVTWLTSKKGRPLLARNPYIHRLITYTPEAVARLKSRNFDIVINLEKEIHVSNLANSIAAEKKYGFKFNPRTNETEAYKQSSEVLANSEDPVLRRKIKDYWTKVLFDMVGARWKRESYILGYRPKTNVSYDIGFNTYVKKRWSSKAWSMSNWKKLEGLIGKRYSISYQKSLNNIYRYIDWINSCRLLVTNDSLGLHLAIALNKKIVALFGPTSEKEAYLGGSGIALRPKSTLRCIPCFMTKCKYTKKCIDLIRPEVVYEKIEQLLQDG